MLLPAPALAQGTLADYARADSLEDRLGGLVIDIAEAPNWIAESNRFWYRKSVAGGFRFVTVDAVSRSKQPSFDHDRMAGAVSAMGPAAGDDPVTAITLPFEEFEFEEDLESIEFELADSTWSCTVTNYVCVNRGAVEDDDDDADSVPWSAGPGQLWRRSQTEPLRSPDGRQEARIMDHNVAVRMTGSEDWVMLSHEGAEADRYTRASMEWSPDSRKLAVYRVVPGHEREVHFIESSPEDQLQPKRSSLLYAKPGDVLDRQRPVIFDVEAKRQMIVDDALFPEAYSMSGLEWREDSRHVTFEYNQRGHEVYRIMQIDAATGDARALISEEPETFFYYSNAPGGKKYRHDVNDGEAIIWMSERDGWNHLYLYDGVTGDVKNRITTGEWVVRGVQHVDEEGRQIWFSASGMNEDQDPYFVHYYRIDFDGSNLVALTDADGDHSVSFSPDRQFYVDRWSRVNHAPVAELRRTSDRSVVMELERADDSALLATGWRYPEVFVAKGRDGVTEIWGIIIRPTNFAPSRSYPVIESIYAGPHGSHVPKTFGTNAGRVALAELGFIVVQIDGMGTSNRSKAFHDVAWKNLKDAGFPDRILWHEAVAERYDYYDTDRVGIYGTSAGGQNSMGALLFHPDFYKVAVSAAGCHDNRMDKIWWNELWMSWPLGPQYAASSNVENAHLLEGRLLLIVGEMDSNVDPSSTLQVVDALIEADKDFDFLFIPGANHTSGGDYGARKRNDFFVRHLLNVEPPEWNIATRNTADGGR
jgi:dipeptidyl aminopeptidase/acylaminoacyl peptidase